MRRKALAWILTLCMVICAVPAMAFANTEADDALPQAEVTQLDAMTLKAGEYNVWGGGSSLTEATKDLALWSMIPAEDAASYRQVTVEIVEAGLIERKYSFPRAFVVDYKEEYGNTDGIGTFRILIKQKKDKLDLVSVDGGYAGA